jgi:hypothetical protein
MTEDPIVQEVRKNREALFAQYGHDLDALVAALRANAQDDPRERVSLPPKRLTRPRK